MTPKIQKFLKLAKSWTQMQKHKNGVYFLMLGFASYLMIEGGMTIAEDLTSWKAWGRLAIGPCLLYSYRRTQQNKLQSPQFVEKHTELKEQLEIAQLEFSVNKMKQLLEDSIAVQATLAVNSEDTTQTIKSAQKRRLNKI